MILLSKPEEEPECASCPVCGTEATIPSVGIVDTLSNLRSLLDDTLNTTTCATCGDPVTADVPIWLNMEAHGLEPLFYMPLSYVERGYFPPEILADPEEAGRIFYSLDELARQVRARIVIHKLEVGSLISNAARGMA